jgi:putative FmdB family regulatory protein
MPLYEYVCDSCGEIFDEFSSIANRNAPTEKPCPSCGETSVRQNLTMPPIADPVRLGRIKAPAGFREILKNVGQKVPGSVLTGD